TLAPLLLSGEPISIELTPAVEGDDSRDLPALRLRLEQRIIGANESRLFIQDRSGSLRAVAVKQSRPDERPDFPCCLDDDALRDLCIRLRFFNPRLALTSDLDRKVEGETEQPWRASGRIARILRRPCKRRIGKLTGDLHRSVCGSDLRPNQRELRVIEEGSL